MSSEKRPLKIVCCGGHGRVVADIARANGEEVSGFLDDAPSYCPPGLQVEGPIADRIEALITDCRFVVASGDAAIRRALAETILAHGGELATLIHPSAVIAPDVTIGDGSVVMAGAIINTGSAVGRFAIVNTGAVVDHDNLLDDNVQVAPGCALAGRVTCREDSFIGTGSVVIPRIVIGRGAYVAAGSTVIRPVADYTLVAGCPAVVKKAILRTA